MSEQLGVHLTRSAIHAVLTRSGGVVATASCSREPGESVHGQLHALMDVLPTNAGGINLTLALEAPDVWSKSVGDLESVPNVRLRERAVFENADQYFLGGVASRVLAVCSAEAGVRAAAFDAPLVNELRHSVEAIGFRSARAVAASLLASRTTDAVDEQLRVATAAALADSRLGPAISLAGGATEGPRWRTRLAAAALVVALVFLAASPIVRLHRATLAAHKEIRATATAYGAASRSIGGVSEITGKLERVRSARGATTITGLLTRITRALPRNSAFVAFAYDTIKGSAVVMSTSVVSVLPALDSVQGIASVRLSGPITRERVGDREMERATILMTWGTAK